MTTFGTSVNGELYCATIGGDIYRVMDVNECPNQRTITNHTQDNYGAEVDITSTATVDAGRDITYTSPEIFLENTFTVETTGTLTAQTMGCLNYILQTKY